MTYIGATRRAFLCTSGLATLGTILAPNSTVSAIVTGNESTTSQELTTKLNIAPSLLEGILGDHAEQFRLIILPKMGEEWFAIYGSDDGIVVEANTLPAVFAGVNWYLRYVAGVSISWNGDCLNMLPKVLPVPATRIEHRASVRHRFALNDTNDAYTGPYWKWDEWKRFIDVLALRGINEVLVYVGAEAVYQRTFQSFGLTEERAREWIPLPGHQPWWLLQNMSVEPGLAISQELLEERLVLGRQICDYLRSLDIVPVMPGYYGMVPNGFVEKLPEARILPRGTWNGVERPSWLDPTTKEFAHVAATYYRVQENLLGTSSMYKMDPLHEGGLDVGLDIATIASSIEAALQDAHPGAIWAILGWQENPRRELLLGIKKKDHVLILDGTGDRYAFSDRNKEWNGVPYAFGSIWNFGGHTTMGANIEVWNDRYFRLLAESGSALHGIAIMPEASCNNPVAFEFLAELAWRCEAVDLPSWFSSWSAYRYGAHNEKSAHAWNILRSTAYRERAGEWSESHDNLFSAQPSLITRSSANWSPREPRYDMSVFALACAPLLSMPEHLRQSDAYRYDLVDVIRQVVANQSRWLLPEIEAAFNRSDLPRFKKLTSQWFEYVDALDEMTGTESSLLLGRWLDQASSRGNTEQDKKRMEFDARSLLVQWGPAAMRDSGIHDYANREWNGLLPFYRERWERYFSSLETSLRHGTAVVEIDWFRVSDDWAKSQPRFLREPLGDCWTVGTKVCRQLVLPVLDVDGLGRPRC